MCIHSARYIRENPEIFNTKRKPWIVADNASKDEFAQVINTCPSGSLKYIYRGETEALPEKATDDYVK